MSYIIPGFFADVSFYLDALLINYEHHPNQLQEALADAEDLAKHFALASYDREVWGYCADVLRGRLALYEWEQENDWTEMLSHAAP